MTALVQLILAVDPSCRSCGGGGILTVDVMDAGGDNLNVEVLCPCVVGGRGLPTDPDTSTKAQPPEGADD